MEDLLIPTAAGGNEHPFGFTKTGRPRRVYKCRDCSRIFKRSEHCARHERVHTRERPFACRFCNKSYARKDLVSRHERSLHPEEHAAAGDFKPRRASHSGPSARKARTRAPESSHDSPGGSTSTDDILSQNGPPTPEGSTNSHARRNSYPVTLSRMMSPSFFNTMEFPLWDFDQSSVNHGGQTHGSGSSEKPGASQHPSPTTTLSLSDKTYNPFESSTGLNGERSASENFPAIPEVHEMDHPAAATTLPSTEHHLLLDTEMDDSFEGLAAQTLPEGVSLDVLRDLYFIPESPLEIPQLPKLPHTFPQTPSLAFQSIHQQNDDSAQALPRVMREKVASPPKMTADDSVYEHLCGDIRGRMREEPDVTAIPRGKELERLMETYISCFHCHFPIIHIASLDLATAPGPLVLSMCVIGALYRLDRRRAVQLHNIASASLHRAVSSHPSNLFSPAAARPLWVVQSCLLLSMYAAFSGQSPAVLSTVEKMGFFKMEFQLRRTALQKCTRELPSPCWDEWILRESAKRLLCGIFIMSNLFSVTYGTTPLFSIEQDLSFEVPSEEKLWDARTAGLWEDARASRSATDPRMTLRETIVTTFFNRQEDLGKGPARVSGFTALLITHAANVHMWSVLQFVQSFAPPLAHEILAATFSALVRWHTALGHGRVEAPEAAYYNNAGIPLVFNCYALLRIAYVRLFGNSGIFNKMILLTDDLEEISVTMASYVSAPQPRNHFLTKSISKAYEGFITPVRLGHLLIKKTAALSWSVEHAVAAWDSVLFVSKWVHAVQMESATQPPDGEEEKILTQLKGLLDEMEYDYDGSGSLAAAVTRAWASFLTDTWVWGVTPRMGYILMQLAVAYDNSYQGIPP